MKTLLHSVKYPIADQKKKQKKIENVEINHLFFKKKTIAFMKMALLSHNSKIADQKELIKNIQHQKMISLQKIELVSQEILQRYTNNMRMQAKQQLIQIKCPQIIKGISQKSKQLRKKEIKKWLSQVCHSVFSIAYNSFKKSQMSEQQTKIYCSENLLLNLIKLSENNNLTVEDYEYIDKVLKNDILSYYKDKYPPTLQKQSYKRFKAEIQDIDIMEQFEEELIKVSKLSQQIKERYKQQVKKNNNNPQYYDLIMQFINFCLQLPDQKPQQSQQKGLSYYDEFQALMTNIFSKVEDINYMRGRKTSENSQKSKKQIKQKENIQPKIQKNNKELKQKKHIQGQKNKKSQKEIEQEQEYRQKVKKYTHYKIGRKIPEHILKFTEEQIKNKNIRIKDPTILRLLTKWLQQLEQNLKNIQSKLTSVGYDLNSKWNKIDYKIIQETKKNRKQLLEVFQTKIYEQQQICNYSYLDNKEIDMIPKNDKIVGIFSYITSQTQSSFIVKSINSIIHNLCQLSSYPNGSFIIPSITCKIGDLIRCKCSSEQKEILKIYQQLKNYSRQKPQTIKIIRTKNRLEKGTKDILINILFKNTILCQIQLSINKDQSSQSILYNFNHYLYQLQRSNFGPISELANVWTKDQRYQHIAKLLDKNQKKNDQNLCQCEIEMKQQINPFPFICNYCDRFYDGNFSFISHKKCQNCKMIWKCSDCSLGQRLKKQIERKELLKQYSQKDDCEYIESGNQNIKIPEYGMFISKVSKTKNFIEFKSYNLPDQQNIYLVRAEGKINTIIYTIQKDKQQQFFSDKILFSIKTISQLQMLDDQKFKKTLLFPKNIKALYKNHSETIKMVLKDLNNEQFDNITKGETKNYENIKSLNLRNNKIQQMGPILTRFNNLQILDLNNNIIQHIPDEIEKMSNLTKIQLNQNKIRTIPQQIGNLKSLTSLQIEKNQIENIPNSIVNLSNLTSLNFFMNKIEIIPEEIGNLKSLDVLVLQSNRVKKIPQSIGKLNNLTALNLIDNVIEVIPESIGNLHNLTNLFISDNIIETIPSIIGNLNNLISLDMYSNKIKTIPQQIGNLKNLKYLDIYRNKIEILPQSFGKLKNLRKLCISSNEIKDFPKVITSLNNLVNLEISNNKIETFPEEIGNLNNLVSLEIAQNKITAIPKSIGSLSSLTSLDISNNKIEIISEQIGNLKSLTLLQISKNCIKTIPKSIENLKSLQSLDASSNKIETISEQIANLKNLISLQISNNEIQYIPESIENLNSLTKFSISNNNIKTIPKLVCKLGNLSELNLSCNKITVTRQLLKLFTEIKAKVQLQKNEICLSEQDYQWIKQNQLGKRISLKYD